MVARANATIPVRMASRIAAPLDAPEPAPAAEAAAPLTPEPAATVALQIAEGGMKVTADHLKHLGVMELSLLQTEPPAVLPTVVWFRNILSVTEGIDAVYAAVTRSGAVVPRLAQLMDAADHNPLLQVPPTGHGSAQTLLRCSRLSLSAR